MKRITILLLTGILAFVGLVPAFAAPVAPDLQVSLTPSDGIIKPGQLILIFVGGGYPLDIQATLDGQPLTFFWSGDGYVGLAAFNLEEPPGVHALTISAIEPGSGRVLDYQATLTVEKDPYPREHVSISGRLADLLDPALNQAEVDEIGAIVGPISQRQEWEWPFAFPVISRLTSLFGALRTYNEDELKARHTGLDFRLAEGVAVFAAAPGRVVTAERVDVRGNVIIIDHGWGVYTLYAHLSSFEVAAGDEVIQGQLIGKGGRTGRSTGTHLHWEVIVNGVAIDPLYWMALSPTYIQPAIDEAADGAFS